MTCIAAIETPDGVWLGSDSWVGNDDWAVTGPPKWRERPHGVVIAACGNLAMTEAAERVRLPKVRPLESARDYAAKIAAAIKRAHERAALPGRFGAILVVGGEAYEVLHDYTTIRSESGYCAVGSGAQYALGALAIQRKVSLTLMNLPEGLQLSNALEAAAELCTEVRGRFHIKYFPLIDVRSTEKPSEAGDATTK